MYNREPVLTTEEWISVLKLSTKWAFNDLRKLAVRHLSSTTMDPIDRICLAKEYRIHEWLLRGYEQVVNRLLTFDPTDASSPTTLTDQEGRRIGMEVALRLSGVVIRRMRWRERAMSLKGVKHDILADFKEEFDRIEADEQHFLTRTEKTEEARKRAEAHEEERRKEAEIERKKAKEVERQQLEEKRKRRKVEEEAARGEKEEAGRRLEEEEVMRLKLEEIQRAEKEPAGVIEQEREQEAKTRANERAAAEKAEEERATTEIEQEEYKVAEKVEKEEASEPRIAVVDNELEPRKLTQKERRALRDKKKKQKEGAEKDQNTPADSAQRSPEATARRDSEQARIQTDLEEANRRRALSEEKQRKALAEEEQRLKVIYDDLAREQARQAEEASIEKARKEKQKMLEKKREMDRLLEEHNAKQKVLEEERAEKEAAKRGLKLRVSQRALLLAPLGMADNVHEQPWVSELDKYFTSG
jgi:hypothetical protein